MCVSKHKQNFHRIVLGFSGGVLVYAFSWELAGPLCRLHHLESDKKGQKRQNPIFCPVVASLGGVFLSCRGSLFFSMFSSPCIRSDPPQKNTNFSAKPCLQILVVERSLKLHLKLCLKLQVQNCEKVPVTNFWAAEQGLNFFGDVSGWVHHGIATAIASDSLNRRRNRKEFAQREASLAIFHRKMHRNRNRIITAEKSQPIFQKESLRTVWPRKGIASFNRKSSPGDSALPRPSNPRLWTVFSSRRRGFTPTLRLVQNPVTYRQTR